MGYSKVKFNKDKFKSTKKNVDTKKKKKDYDNDDFPTGKLLNNNDY